MLTADQRHGARFLRDRLAAYLADVPGLGKTAQYIRAFDLAGATSGVVVCPPILRPKLQDEWDKWSFIGHKVHVVETGKSIIPDDGIAAVSYNLATQPDILAQLVRRKPGPVIFDEAHALKNFNSKRTRTCLGELIRNATHAWFVSGTPAPNHAAELFPFLAVAGLWKGSEYEAFVERFCTTRPSDRDPCGYSITGSKNQAELRALFAPVILRRTEVEGRPPLSIDTIAVEATDAYAELAPEHALEISTAMASGDWSFEDYEHISTVRRLIGLAKIPATAALARQEIESGHKRLLIFGTHIATLEQLTAELADLGAALINGKTSDRVADKVTRDFQDASITSPRVIVGNMQTMGEAITLTECSRILIAEPSWTPKDNEQVIARAWRRGQKRPVHASFLSVAGSIDDAITRTVARKTKQIMQLY